MIRFVTRHLEAASLWKEILQSRGPVSATWSGRCCPGGPSNVRGGVAAYLSHLALPQATQLPYLRRLRQGKYQDQPQVYFKGQAYGKSGAQADPGLEGVAPGGHGSRAIHWGTRAAGTEVTMRQAVTTSSVLATTPVTQVPSTPVYR